MINNVCILWLRQKSLWMIQNLSCHDMKLMKNGKFSFQEFFLEKMKFISSFSLKESFVKPLKNCKLCQYSRLHS